jgi:hypothetical protein
MIGLAVALVKLHGDGIMELELPFPATVGPLAAEIRLRRWDGLSPAGCMLL